MRRRSRAGDDADSELLSSNFNEFAQMVFPGPISFDEVQNYQPVSQMEGEEDAAGWDESPVGEREATVPYILLPFIRPNAGLFISYFNVGIASFFLSSPLSYYLIDTLDVSATSYSAYVTLVTIPWSLKFILGTISDSTPILGYRRKPWMALGWAGYVLTALALAMTGGPTFLQITIFGFVLTVGYLMADVVNDAMCVERSKFEPEEIKGATQTCAYTIRAFGCVVGALLGATLYNSNTWGWGLTICQLLVLSALLPLSHMLPSLWHLQEVAIVKTTPTVSEIAQGVWETLQLRAVWYPMIFIYTYYILQVPNAAWTNFLVKGLNFTDFELGMLQVSGSLLYYLGMVTYKTFLFDHSWRNIFIFTTAVNFVFSLLQVLLVLRFNQYLGIPDLVFALGDSGIIYFVFAINSMPTSIMFVMLCPDGAEGVTYALLTTISNLAWSVSYDIGTWISTIFDVSNATIASGNYDGVLQITILTSFLQTMPIMLVGILPNSRAEQRELRDSGIRSKWGGGMLVLVVVMSLLVTIFYNTFLVAMS